MSTGAPHHYTILHGTHLPYHPIPHASLMAPSCLTHVPIRARWYFLFDVYMPLLPPFNLYTTLCTCARPMFMPHLSL
jgi:hypothetical protein